MNAYTYSDALYSDLHKDAYGFRPGESGMSLWAAATPEQKQAKWDSMLESLQISAMEEVAAEKRAVARFEETVAAVIAASAKDRITAIRWLFEAEGDDYIFSDPDYYCHIHGLPYGYFNGLALDVTVDQAA